MTRDSEIYQPGRLPRGTVAILGHPGSKILIVKGQADWRYVDNGEVVDPEDFRAGWDIHLPEHDEHYEDESPEPEMVGHPDNLPVNSHTVLSGYRNLVAGLDRFNRSVHPNVRVSVPFGVQEALRRYIDERKAIESIWSQQQEDQAKEPWP